MPFVQSSLASFPTDFICRILTTKFYLVTKKLSRPYEMGILLGWRWIQLLPWNATWPVETVPIPPFVKHKTEDTRHQILNIALPTTYPIGYASTGTSAFWAGIWRHPKTHRGEMAHHRLARGNRVPPARIPDKSFPCDALRWMRSFIWQRHLPPWHQGKLHLPSRHQEWSASYCQRRTARMVFTGCHLPCIIPKATAQRQILLHHDVIRQQQPLRQETLYWKEIDTYGPYCNVTRTCGHGCRRLQRQCMTPPIWQWSSTH